MSWEMEGSQAWDAAANDAYVTVNAPRLAHYSADALLLSPPSKHDSILDVACGPGHLSIQAARMGVRHVVATDWSKDMIDHLKHSLLDEAPSVQQSVKVFVEDGETLKSIPDSSMDKIYSIFGIFLFPRLELAIKTAFQVLKPKGQLIFSFWLPEMDPVPSFTSICSVIFAHMGFLPNTAEFKSEDFKAMLMQNGFEKVEEVRVSHSLAFKDGNEVVRSFMGRNPFMDAILLNASDEKLEECKSLILKHVCDNKEGPGSFHSAACFLIATKKD